MMPVIIDTRVPRHTGLNRTFYGIETATSAVADAVVNVLIVPFMELKRFCNIGDSIVRCLNRTFYGIETLRCL